MPMSTPGGSAFAGAEAQVSRRFTARCFKRWSIGFVDRRRRDGTESHALQKHSRRLSGRLFEAWRLGVRALRARRAKAASKQTELRWRAGGRALMEWGEVVERSKTMAIRR
eukprot:3830881-Rhodomonas_salina.1